MKETFVIAEAGVNHNGDELLARELIDVASTAGADAVKFQTFKVERLATTRAMKADYQKTSKDNKSDQVEMLKGLELDEDSFFRLSEYAKTKNIRFMSTAFDLLSLKFLIKKVKLDTLKIPSGEIINAPYLLGHTKYKTKMILSTGMATLAEIESALAVIAFGLLYGDKKAPTQKAFLSAYASSKGQELLKKYVALLHCTTEYPTKYSEANLRCIKSLRYAFGLPVGFSDHTEGISPPIAAVALGANIIEKHFTLDKNLPGPDHKASLIPNELNSMISGIRNIEKALGNGVRTPTVSELKNKLSTRQSIVALQNIRVGEKLTEKNTGTRRPGSGLSPFLFWDIIGTTAVCDFKKGDEIRL